VIWKLVICVIKLYYTDFWYYICTPIKIKKWML